MDLALKEKILNYVSSVDYAVPCLELYEACRATDKKSFVNCLGSLKDEAKVVETKRDKIATPSYCGFTPAKIMSHSKNFLFARPLFGGEDIYISVEKSRGAMLDDVIMVNRVKQSPRGLSGAVERIVKNGTRNVIGTFVRSRRGFEIIPDKGYRYGIPVKRGKTMGASTDDKVEATIYLEKGSRLIFAKVTKIYGDSQSARVCADAIIDKNSIPTVFSAQSKELAKKLESKSFTSKELEHRLDLRDKSIFTIDGSDSKDLDDAISVEKAEFGYKLGVHIADVSHYVKDGSAIDEDAKLRGNSVYFADRVIPMLPKELSNGICSLHPGVDRLTFSAFIDIDKKGNLLDFSLCKSIIRSKVKGVYSEVNSVLDGSATNEIVYKYSTVRDSILLAHELYLLLLKTAKDRGNMPIETTESKFTLNKNGVCVDVCKKQRGVAEEIIEQFMITANRAVAKFADGNDIPFIYRVHGAPDPEKIISLANVAGSLDFKTAKIRPGAKPSDFARLLEEAESTKYKQAVSNQVLRTMQKAKYSHEPLGHFGLSLHDYCHFTSPIRRYSDLVIHRILSDLIKLKPKAKICKKYSNFVIEQSLNTSNCEMRAMKSERDAEACYMAEYMSFHIGEVFRGRISGVVESGVFVELENSVEGFIGIEYFMNSNFKFDGFISHVDATSGKKLTIGDKLSVTAISANVSSVRIDFAPYEYSTQ